VGFGVDSGCMPDTSAVEEPLVSQSRIAVGSAERMARGIDAEAEKLRAGAAPGFDVRQGESRPTFGIAAGAAGVVLAREKCVAVVFWMGRRN